VAYVLGYDLTVNTKEFLYHLNKREEEILLALHHKEVQNKQQKAWHDRHLRKKYTKLRDLVIMYDS
jgi:hypothetical protein